MPNSQRLAPKGWREPPGLRSPQLCCLEPTPGLQKAEDDGSDSHVNSMVAGKSAAHRSPVATKAPRIRGSTCPPSMRRNVPEEQLMRRVSKDEHDDAMAPSRRPMQRPGQLGH